MNAAAVPTNLSAPKQLVKFDVTLLPHTVHEVVLHVVQFPL